MVIAASLSVERCDLQSSLAYIISSDGWKGPVRSGGQVIMISVREMIEPRPTGAQDPARDHLTDYNTWRTEASSAGGSKMN